MAVPKRRTSRSNTRERRAQWKATPPDLVPITIAGRRHCAYPPRRLRRLPSPGVPRRLVRAYQRGLLTPE